MMDAPPIWLMRIGPDLIVLVEGNDGDWYEVIRESDAAHDRPISHIWEGGELEMMDAYIIPTNERP